MSGHDIDKPISDEVEFRTRDEVQSQNEVVSVIPVGEVEQIHIRRKLDRHLMPLICVLYVLSYLDRGNIGNAKTSGIMEDLGLNNENWVWVLQAFYIVYTVNEWTTMMWKLLPAHIYVAILCILWGTAATCTGAVQGFGGLVACRAFLGLFEAAFGAGAPFFLSLFYQRRELGLRVAILTGMSPLANCFASALAYGILQIKSSAIESWRLLFIIEGVPTIPFALVVFLFLPDSPSKARFLSTSEREAASTRLETVDTTSKSKANWRQVVAAVTDYKAYTHALIHFCCNYSFAGLSNFLPTIVEEMGYSSVNAQGLIAPAYLGAFVCCMLASWLSDRYRVRGWVLVGFATMGTVGYLLLAVVDDLDMVRVRYMAVWLACCGVFPALAINITWLLNNQGGDSEKGAAMGILATVGQCSSFVSSVMYPASDGPFYVRGTAVGCGLTGLIVIMALVLRFMLKRNNDRRDRLYGRPDDNLHLDVTRGGDQNTSFRYLI